MRVESRILLINLTRWMAQRRRCVLPFNCNCFVRPSIVVGYGEEGSLVPSIMLGFFLGSFVSFGGDDA